MNILETHSVFFHFLSFSFFLHFPAFSFIVFSIFSFFFFLFFFFSGAQNLFFALIALRFPIKARM